MSEQEKLLLDIQSRLIRLEEILTGSRVRINPKFERKGNFKESKYQAMIDVLNACGGNKALACRTLGVSRATLWRALKEKCK